MNKYAQNQEKTLKTLKKVKDEGLRIRCETVVNNLAIPKREFYERAKVSPQYWWRLSYGYDEFPIWLKKHLFREFGDVFSFLFSEELYGGIENE